MYHQQRPLCFRFAPCNLSMKVSGSHRTVTGKDHSPPKCKRTGVGHPQNWHRAQLWPESHARPKDCSGLRPSQAWDKRGLSVRLAQKLPCPLSCRYTQCKGLWAGHPVPIAFWMELWGRRIWRSCWKLTVLVLAVETVVLLCKGHP